MILPKEFYNKCCPSYKKAIDELEQKIADNPRMIKSEIIKFSRRFLTPAEYWISSFRLIDSLNRKGPFYAAWEKVCIETAEQAYFHLHYLEDCKKLFYGQGDDDYFNAYGERYFKLIDFQQEYSVYENGVQERDISFPHSSIVEYVARFEKKLSRLPTKEFASKYEAMKNHYVKLRTFEADIIEWFMLLCDVNDIDFVKENVECRLGQDYFNVRLWRLYLAFLKERGEYKSLLETYSKYCRFFLDDLKMKEQYKNATIQYGQIKLPWDNLFDFEGENVIEEAKEESEVGMKEVVSFDKNLCASFYDTLQNQDFALPGPLIFYLLKNADNRMLRKLFASCKYFFAKQSTPICYRFDTGLDTTFYDENLCLDYNANPSLFFNNIYITGSLNVVQHHKFLSNLMPRIYRCDAKHIYLNSQALTFNELKFFIQHGKVVEMDLPNSQILDGNGDCVNLEAFMEYLPAIEILSLPKVKTNSKTGHALAKLKFTGKLSSLSIAKIVGEPFDPIEFQKFVVANKFVHFSMKFKFAADFDGVFVEKFKQVMKESFGEENVYIIKLRF